MYEHALAQARALAALKRDFGWLSVRTSSCTSR
jgi:hypothetical protein